MPEMCIFCEISAGRIPSARVYEDDKTFVFLDINPVAKGHALVVPKTHAPTLLDLPDGFGGAILRVMAQVGRAQMQALGAEGFNCLQNNFSAAGQEVMHLHWHVIPRFFGDGLTFAWKPRAYDNRAEMFSLAKKCNSIMSGYEVKHE